MEYVQFDKDRLTLRKLSQRTSQVSYTDCLHLDDKIKPRFSEQINGLLEVLHQTLQEGRPCILAMGAHLIKLGLSRIIIDLIQRGYITHIAMNGASVIHDYELSVHGETSEDVAEALPKGEFGFWEELDLLNMYVNEIAAEPAEGLGQGLGRIMHELHPTHGDLSILKAAYEAGIPATVHIGLGQDILHMYPNFNPIIWADTSYRDFLIFANSIENIGEGLFWNVGSAVMGPEVFLKALSMALNVGATLNFHTAVMDLKELPGQWEKGPHKSDPLYYFRPWKTILCRALNKTGRSFYIKGDFTQTLPGIWKRLKDESADKGIPVSSGAGGV